MPGSGQDRAEIARRAADAVADADVSRVRALIGFDGFLDSIIRVVDRRRSMAADDFERIATIGEFAARVGSAAGRSANIELVVDEERFGGNGPLMAGAVGQLGLRTTYVGAVGRLDDPGRLHPVWGDFAERCERVIPIAPPAFTDALEFHDGKVMLGKPANVQAVTWERIKEAVGLADVRELVARSALVGIVNWTLCGGVEGIWRGLMEEVLPGLPPRDEGPIRIFVDLSDPAKRTDEDIARALSILGEMNGAARVTLGLNLAESERIARVLGLGAYDDAHNRSQGEMVREAAALIREKSGLDCVAVHPRQGAGAGDASGNSVWFEGPFTTRPKLSTGAGDHFNGGFAVAQALGLPLEQCLAVGTAVSGAYVRDAVSPTRDRLVEFLRDLPEPERG